VVEEPLFTEVHFMHWRVFEFLERPGVFPLNGVLSLPTEKTDENVLLSSVFSYFSLSVGHYSPGDDIHMVVFRRAALFASVADKTAPEIAADGLSVLARCCMVYNSDVKGYLYMGGHYKDVTEERLVLSLAIEVGMVNVTRRLVERNNINLGSSARCDGTILPHMYHALSRPLLGPLNSFPYLRDHFRPWDLENPDTFFPCRRAMVQYLLSEEGSGCQLNAAAGPKLPRHCKAMPWADWLNSRFLAAPVQGWCKHFRSEVGQGGRCIAAYWVDLFDLLEDLGVQWGADVDVNIRGGQCGSGGVTIGMLPQRVFLELDVEMDRHTFPEAATAAGVKLDYGEYHHGDGHRRVRTWRSALQGTTVPWMPLGRRCIGWRVSSVAGGGGPVRTWKTCGKNLSKRGICLLLRIWRR
jgi:hypothetical protein